MRGARNIHACNSPWIENILAARHQVRSLSGAIRTRGTIAHDAQSPYHYIQGIVKAVVDHQYLALHPDNRRFYRNSQNWSF